MKYYDIPQSGSLTARRRPLQFKECSAALRHSMGWRTFGSRKIGDRMIVLWRNPQIFGKSHVAFEVI